MKILQSQLNKSRDRKRMIQSFAIAFLVYVPITGLIFWQTPSLDFAAAGQSSTFSITLSQVTGGAVAPALEQPETTPTTLKPLMDTSEKPQETVPEKPTQMQPNKPQPIERKKQTPPEQKIKTSRPQSVQASAVNTRQSSGGQTAGNQGGISTLVYGEVSDAFLSAVKSSVEKSLVYPRRARSKRIEGVVTLQFFVGLDGQLNELTVYRSSGNGLLDNAALRAVRKAQPSWPRPTRSVRLRFPIVFRIAD